MSNGLVLPQGPGAGGPAQPQGMTINIDPAGYQDVFCPYQSGVWGGGATVTQMVGKGMAEQSVVTPHGHSYVRCHNACALFDAETNGCKAARQLDALAAARSLLQAAHQQFPDMEAGLEAVRKIDAEQEGASA